jgi:hypothetical protein
MRRSFVQRLPSIKRLLILFRQHLSKRRPPAPLPLEYLAEGHHLRAYSFAPPGPELLKEKRPGAA